MITAGGPGQAISIDHLEPSKTPTSRGKRAVLVIVDDFSSHITAHAVSSTGVEESIKVVMEKYILVHGGFPEIIRHDLG